MPVKPTKTAAQIRRMFGLARPLHMAKEDLEALAFEITGERTDHLSALTFDEANAVIGRLGGEPFGKGRPRSRRSVQRDRQLAGVVNIDLRRSLKLLDELWSAFPGRSPDGLEKLCARMIKHPRPLHTTECGKVIEAVKSMNAREIAREKEAA